MTVLLKLLINLAVVFETETLIGNWTVIFYELMTSFIKMFAIRKANPSVWIKAGNISNHMVILEWLADFTCPN